MTNATLALRCVAITVVVWLVAPSVTSAEPRFEMGMGVGSGLGIGDVPHAESYLGVRFPVLDGYTLGTELSGTLEGYTGGWGCGTVSGSGEVPSLAVVCLQPSWGVHSTVGKQWQLGAAQRLSVSLGLGTTVLYMVPGEGGETEQEIFFSAANRCSWMLEVGEAFTGRWHVGIQASHRAYQWGELTHAFAFGLVVGADSLDEL